MNEEGNSFTAEVEVSWRQKFVGVDGQLNEIVMYIQREKEKDCKDILKLRNKSGLSLILRIENIGCGKAHLIAYDVAAKFNGGEDQSSHEANHGSEEELVDGEKKKARIVEGKWCSKGFKDGKEDHGYHQDQGYSDANGRLGAEKYRRCADEAGNTCGNDSKFLNLFYGNELQVHVVLKGGKVGKEAGGKGDHGVYYPRAKDEKGEKDGDDLGDEGECLLVYLGCRLENRNDESRDHASKQHGGRTEEYGLNGFFTDIDSKFRRHRAPLLAKALDQRTCYKCPAIDEDEEQEFKRHGYNNGWQHHHAHGHEN